VDSFLKFKQRRFSDIISKAFFSIKAKNNALALICVYSILSEKNALLANSDGTPQPGFLA
jgi:hypothetical protein